jgi:hypothetical protein
MNFYKLVFVVLVSISVVSCTWVKMTPEGQKVRVLAADEVSSCKKLGQTEVSLKDEVAGFKRGEEKVKKELEALARNSAANMDGDTVVPITDIEDGKRTFAVYRCVNP